MGVGPGLDKLHGGNDLHSGMARLALPYAEIAKTLLADIAQFRGWSESEAARRMQGARDERNRLWIAANPRNEAEREALYSSLGELDLLKYAEWHRHDKEKQALHDEMVELARKQRLEVLDCGGGIGDTALAFAGNGVAVTYLDVPGPCSDFARFRWEKHGCAERVRRTTLREFDDLLRASFGMIASFDVLEHLENPVHHVRRYIELLRPGGHLFVTTFFEHSSRNPDHLPENDGYRRIFGGEPKTSRRCVLSNLGLKRRRWYCFQKPAG